MVFPFFRVDDAFVVDDDSWFLRFLESPGWLRNKSCKYNEKQVLESQVARFEACIIKNPELNFRAKISFLYKNGTFKIVCNNTSSLFKYVKNHQICKVYETQFV